MTAKEKVLEQAPSWTEAQATAVLAVVEAQRKLEAYFEAEAKLTPAELKAREDHRAEANARELIAEGQVRELSEEEWEQMADEQARKYLGISAAQVCAAAEDGGDGRRRRSERDAGRDAAGAPCRRPSQA